MLTNRITCITMFDDESLKKIENFLKDSDIKLCKLKYKEKKREENDKLPFHSTICVWNNIDKTEVINIVENIKFGEIKLKVIGTKIKASSNDGFNLYFELEKNDELINILKYIYEKSKVEKYNPNTFIPHITIHIDRDYSKIINLQKEIMEKFKPFNVKFKKLGLYEIYPPKKII